jgi:hypothetical protein
MPSLGYHFGYSFGYSRIARRMAGAVYTAVERFSFAVKTVGARTLGR